MIHAKFISSMEKCFLDSKLNEFEEMTSDICFKNEKYFFQLVWSCDETDNLLVTPVIRGSAAEYVKIYEVANVPSEMPVLPRSDSDCVRRTPGLYPDMLRKPLYRGRVRNNYGYTRALMFEFDPRGNVSGTAEFTVEFLGNRSDYDKSLETNDEVLWSGEFKVEIIDANLPKQKLMFSQWFYADCIADYYRVPVFSDEHFEICENFIKKGVEYGRNMWLLPLMTYSLDTYPGGERTTVQLIDVYKNGSEYTFGYEKLDRWLDMCARCGVEYYEVTHFYSQWGVLHTPKVMAYENGQYKRIFGWDTDSLSEEYVTFLRAFITGFLEHMRARGEDKKCWFHISDEPQKEHLERYKAAKANIADLLKGYHIMDALSEYEFYAEGVVETPVPATRAIKPFLENNVPDLWCYYCGGHVKGVSNALFSIPLARTRFIGTQFFAYDITGFLNWGYNFYNDQWSYDSVDPLHTSDGSLFVPSGDTYAVYPMRDGSAAPSIRMMAFLQGLQDCRAMEFCAGLYSKEYVLAEIEKICGKVVFDKCVSSSREMNRIRARVYELIKAKI